MLIVLWKMQEFATVVPFPPRVRPLPPARELGRPGVCVLTEDGLILTEGEAIRRKLERKLAERLNPNFERGSAA